MNYVNIHVHFVLDILVDATLSGAYVIPVTQSPIYALIGSTVNFTYRIGLANDSLDVVSNVKVVFTTDIDMDEPQLIYQGNSFYEVQFPSICCDLEFFLEFDEEQVSPFASIFAQGKDTYYIIID